jgi:hypothetical protein
VSNLHVASLTGHFNIRKRADLFVGYSHTQDTGDGRQLISSPFFGQSAFYTAQTYPLRFLSPMARFSFRINQKLRWNVGYQYYGYNADFYSNLDYHAHTSYTSLLWSF